jgi:VanZ family protein
MDKYYQFLQRYWLNILLWLYIFFIIFSTVVPFNFIWSTSFIPARLAKIQWIPFKDGIMGLNRSDIVANIIFFAPLGVLLALKVILREYRNLKSIEWIRIILTGALISTGVEVLQIFTFDRTTSTTDVITNTIGTFLGGVLILFLYLKFHREIKFFLIKVFAGKPEMIIAGLFLIFITLSTLAPFTFRIAWYSVKEQILLVKQNPFMVRNPVGELLTHMLLFGTFIYFLLSGIERYFRERIRRLEIISIVCSLFILPVLLETMQLLVPARNHSLADILINQLAILLILLYYLIQLKIHPIKFNREYFIHRHIRFFYFLAFIYFLFIVQRVAFSEISVSSWTILKSMVPQITINSKALRNYNRLNLLILLAKELFAFLPAGFILSLIWLKKFKKSMRRSLLIFFIIFIPMVYYYIGSALERLQLNILDFAAAVSGITLGYICWHIYQFMIEKNL